MRPARVGIVVVAAALLSSAVRPARAQDAPPPVRTIAVDEHPGRRLPLDRELVDEAGGSVPLGRYFSADDPRPVLLVPGWFRCDMLCGVLAPRLSEALRATSEWTAGEDYRVVLLSIDPREGPADAAARRRTIGNGYLPGWSLVTGPEASVRAIADAIGFGYRYDPRTDQFAHAALVVAVASDGTVARYVYGVDPSPDELAEVLAAARDRRAAASLEQVLVRCFRFSPALRRHAGLLANVLRGGAVVILLGLASLFVAIARRGVREETT